MGFAGNPFGLMRRLSDDLDQLFGQLIGAPGASRGGTPFAGGMADLGPSIDWMPEIEAFERGGKLVVQADLPGIGVDDVTVEVADGILTISGERREEREIDDNGFRRTERRYGRFSRSVALPEGIRSEDIQAMSHNGVLEITMPMPQQTSDRRKIQVQSASPGDQSKAGAGTSKSAGTTAGEQAQGSTH
jgi:HSP20 family protein